jgi:glycerate 2-kinase
MLISPEKFATTSLRLSPWGGNICQVLSAVLDHADPGSFVYNNVSVLSDSLLIQSEHYNLRAYERIYLIGAGKAVVPMAAAVSSLLGDCITAGLLITKDGYVDQSSSIDQSKIKIIEAAHPVPDGRSVSATAELLSLTCNLNSNDLVICLISGGGSSLLVKPASGLSVADIQETSSLLLNSGAVIDEINIVRKHLDDVKGGGLAKRLFPATVVTLILSDVMGGNLAMVASGPTVADSSTYRDAQAILSKYDLLEKVPIAIRSHLAAGTKRHATRASRSENQSIMNVHNYLVGDNKALVSIAEEDAKNHGFQAGILPFTLAGESSLMGKTIVDYITQSTLSSGKSPPSCLITGGETTVTVKGLGKGGRNQELALGAVNSLSSTENMILVSLATDGGDGPTDAAGAVVTHWTLSRSLALGLDPSVFLERNDSYNYFDRLGDLIRIGPTFTNVNDLVFIFRG